MRQTARPVLELLEGLFPPCSYDEGGLACPLSLPQMACRPDSARTDRPPGAMVAAPLLSCAYTVWRRWQPLDVCGHRADNLRTGGDQLCRPMWTLRPPVDAFDLAGVLEPRHQGPPPAQTAPASLVYPHGGLAARRSRRSHQLSRLCRGTGLHAGLRCLIDCLSSNPRLNPSRRSTFRGTAVRQPIPRHHPDVI